MAKRLSITLLALLALGFAVTGCGDDDEDDTKNDTSAATAPATTGEQGGGADGGGGRGVGTPGSPQRKQAIKDCKEQSNRNPRLSRQAKVKLGDVCEKAASGDTDGAIKATREACQIIIADTTPAGPDQRRALEACKQSGRTP